MDSFILWYFEGLDNFKVIFNALQAGKDRFVACACNVGDSLAYVYSPTEGHVREITQGSHDIQSNRDMRDALGELKSNYSTRTHRIFTGFQNQPAMR